MSIYIGNDLEDRLKILEMEYSLLRKYNEYHQVVHEIDHMSDLHVDSSFYKQSTKIDNHVTIKEWIDFSIGQSTVLQELDNKKRTLSDLNQTQNRRRYVNFENGSHFICSLNLNNPESAVFIVFRMTNITSRDQEIVNSLIGNNNKKSMQCKVYNVLQNIWWSRFINFKSTAWRLRSIANEGIQSENQILNFLPQNQIALF